MSYASLGLAVLMGWTGLSSRANADSSNSPTPNGIAQAEPKRSKGQAQEYRLEWNRKTLAADYERFGTHDAKWDEWAKRALELFAQLRTGGQDKMKTVLPDLGVSLMRAVIGGCNDPEIKYLHARFVMPVLGGTPQEQATVFRAVADQLSGSQRPAIRKYYAALRAATILNPGTNAPSTEIRHWREQTQRFLTEVVNDQATPVGEVCDAWEAYLDAVPDNTEEHYQPYSKLEPILFKNWPTESSLFLLKGRFYTDYAWWARGTGWADSVTPKGGEDFEKRLGIAEKALEEAWRLDPSDARIARRMITVEMGQGRGRTRMEQWFERAMALNPNYCDACLAKLLYLCPKWHDSREEMIGFASECLRSEKWGGKVPCIVLEAHKLIAESLDATAQNDYWKLPEVYPQIKQALDKLIRLNPGVEDWHHNYALYAFRAEQWADLNRELKLIGRGVDYGFFGGKEEFDRITRIAKEHAGKAN